MALVAGVFAALLGTGVSFADPLPPPMGPAPVGAPGPRMGRPRGQLRAMLVQRFDRDGDGRLSPRERKRAARALHRLANKLDRQGHGPRRAELIQRFDTNGDGNVRPEEMPPGLAKRLRHRDRNGDGWVRGDEMP